MAESSWVSSYLGFLGLSGLAAEPPGLAALTRLVRAQVLRVPFENVTTLLRYREHARSGAPGSAPPPPDPAVMLARWQARGGGGICYDCSRPFGRLLRALGYRCWPVTGTILWPNDHEALLVELGDRRYLVDVGNGAPFLTPIPLGAPFLVEHAGLRYRFRPGDEPGTHIQDRQIDGAWTPFCRLAETPRSEADLEPAYRRHHTPGRSKFMGELMAVRCTPDEVFLLRDDQLTRFHAGGKESRRLETASEYRQVAAEILDLPGLPILEGLDVLRSLRSRREGAG